MSLRERTRKRLPILSDEPLPRSVAKCEQFAALPADRYPMIVAMREQLVAGSGDQRARWALKVLVNGILHTPAE